MIMCEKGLTKIVGPKYSTIREFIFILHDMYELLGENVANKCIEIAKKRILVVEDIVNVLKESGFKEDESWH